MNEYMFPENLYSSGTFILSILLLVPLLGSLALFFVSSASRARFVAACFSGVAFLLSLLMFINHYDMGAPGFQLVEVANWMPAFGANYLLGIDGLSVLLVLLTTFLSFLVVVSSGSVKKHVPGYLAAVLLLETGMLGTFFALDALTFYIFWELMLIPMYFLIGVWGGPRRIYASLKFVLYTAFGSLLMLVAIVFLAYLHYEQFGFMSFYLGHWERLDLPQLTEYWLFAAFALAFAIKVPIFPLHTWLPDAHVEAPTGGSVILAGVLLKMGLYGLMRFGIPIFPEATIVAAPIFAVLGVLGIIFGALVAWVQTDMKKLVAYSSVSHLGYCVFGFAALNFQGLQGCVLQMLNHGVSTAALFLLVGVVYERKHSRLISDYGGLASKTPMFSLVFLVFTLSSIGLPLTNGFVGEFLILLGGFKYSPVLGVFAVTGVVLGALYMLSLYRRVVFGPLNEERNGDLQDLNWKEGLVFAPLLILVFWVGIKPQPFLDIISPSSQQTVSYLQGYREKAFNDALKREFSHNIKITQVSGQKVSGQRASGQKLDHE